MEDMMRCGVCGDPGQMRCGGNHTTSGIKCGICGEDTGLCHGHIHNGKFKPKAAVEVAVAVEVKVEEPVVEVTPDVEVKAEEPVVEVQTPVVEDVKIEEVKVEEFIPVIDEVIAPPVVEEAKPRKRR